MSVPLVSIIIPVYNAENYLKSTILSALAQTWPNKEIIIVNDGSTDGSLAAAKQYEAHNVKIYSQPNTGASSARNKGLQECKGEFIQFLDADDLIDPQKIARQVNIMQNTADAIAYCSFAVFFDDKNLPDTADGYLHKDYSNGRDFLFDLYGGRDGLHSTGGMIPTVCWLVAKSVIEKAGGWDETLSVDDDGEFFCRMALSSKSVKYVAEANGFYRAHTHNKNLSSQSSCSAYTSGFNALRLKKQHVNDKKFNTLFANHAVQLMVSVYPNCKALCVEIKTFIEESGGNIWQPYRENPHKFFRRLFGWRLVRLLSYYKNK